MPVDDGDLVDAAAAAGPSSTQRHPQRQTKQQQASSLPKLQTSSLKTGYSIPLHSPSTVNPAPLNGRPASPILTSAISMHDLAVYDGYDTEQDNIRQPRSSTIRQPVPLYGDSHASSSSSHHSNATRPSLHSRSYSTSSNPRPSSSSNPHSKPISRSNSRNSVARSPSPIAYAHHQQQSSGIPLSSPNNVGGTTGAGSISRSTTPLLHHPHNQSSVSTTATAPNMATSHSSSSFLLGSTGDSHTQLPSGGHSTIDLHETGPFTSLSSTPHTPRRHMTTRKSMFKTSHGGSIFSPAYIHHRLQDLIRDTKVALAIGIPGEWRDLNTGKRKIPQHLKAYIPLLIWVGVSIAFGVIVGVWHDQVFAGLDALSTYLKEQGYLGDFILYLCIFITTFPPLPLYSTLIILSGYSFGLLEGFIISYTAALSGAVVVYCCSKIWLKDGMEELLNKSQGLKKVVRAIERRPRLLWLIRLSPYPYNVMNVLLASSSTLSFSCYFWCTALALPKLLIHCSVGTTIRSFAESAKSSQEGEDAGVGGGDADAGLEREQSGQRMKTIAGIVGILLCIAVFLYILVIARRAVDELDESDRLPSNESDTRSRSSTIDGPSGHDGIPEGRTSMAEYRPLSAGVSGHRPAFLRPSIESSPPSLRHGVFVDGRKSMSMLGDNGGEGHGMVHQRSGFERQDSNMPLGNGNKRGYSVDLPPAYHANGHSMELEKKGVSETRVEWADANAEETDGERAGLLDGGAGR